MQRVRCLALHIGFHVGLVVVVMLSVVVFALDLLLDFLRWLASITRNQVREQRLELVSGKFNKFSLSRSSDWPFPLSLPLPMPL